MHGSCGSGRSVLGWLGPMPPLRGNLPRSSRRGLAAGAAVLAAALAAVCVRAGRATYLELHPPRVVADPSGARVLGEVEPIVVHTADGLRLRGWWHPSVNGGAVVLAHGDAANRGQLLPEAAALARAGFGVLLVDLRGHGASDGTMTTLGDRERLDVDAAVAFAAGKPGVRAVGVLGFSIGGLAALDAAAGDPRIRAVAALSTCPSLATMLRREHPGPVSGLVAVLTARALGVDVERTRPDRRLCAIAPRPVLVVEGERDPEAPPAMGAVLARGACGPVEVWPVAGGGHGDWHGPAGDAARARIVAFFEAALAPVHGDAYGAPGGRSHASRNTPPSSSTAATLPGGTSISRPAASAIASPTSGLCPTSAARSPSMRPWRSRPRPSDAPEARASSSSTAAPVASERSAAVSAARA